MAEVFPRYYDTILFQTGSLGRPEHCGPGSRVGFVLELGPGSHRRYYLWAKFKVGPSYKGRREGGRDTVEYRAQSPARARPPHS